MANINWSNFVTSAYRSGPAELWKIKVYTPDTVDSDEVRVKLGNMDSVLKISRPNKVSGLCVFRLVLNPNDAPVADGSESLFLMQTRDEIVEMLFGTFGNDIIW